MADVWLNQIEQPEHAANRAVADAVLQNRVTITCRARWETMMKRSILTACAAVVLSACAASAQGYGEAADSVHLRNECRLAAQVIRTGQPAGRRQWAYDLIPGCGADGGAVMAARLRELRLSSDAREIRAETQRLALLRDGNVYAASMELAQDEGATEAARTFAFRNLLWLVEPAADPAFTPWDPRGLGCTGFVHDRMQINGAPLPDGYADQITQVARQVFLNPNTPGSVRYGARCVLSYTHSLNSR